MTQTTIAPSDSLTRCGPEGVLVLVDSLPEWCRDLDDDPVWVRDVETVGLALDLFPLSPLVSLDTITAATQHDCVQVRVADITTAGQRFIRLDAVAHYLRNPNKLFDPDGWFGQNYPVLFRRLDGTYRILDGTNRTAAARIRGDEHLTAYVLDEADHTS